MEASPLLYVAWPAFLLTLTLIAWKLSSGVTDVVFLFCLVFGLFYGFRPLLMMLGLDVPYPERYFTLATSSALAATTLLWLIAFLGCFAAGVYVVRERARPQGSLFFARQPPSVPRLIVATLALTAFASAISAYMILQYGGVGNFVTAVKVEKALAGLYFLKVPASVGAVIAIATFIEALRSGDRRPAVLGGLLVCAVVNGFSVFIWGQRSTLVILGVILVLGTAATQRRTLRLGALLVRLVLAVVIVIAVSTGLRLARDQLIANGVNTTIAQSNPYRQASVATNSIYFDSSMLAFRDWPAVREYRGGEDFVNGFAGFVPRKVWPGKPENVTIGRTFRSLYQPDVVNGWPLGAPTLWWLNFGPLGLLMGGLLSGIGFGWISAAQRNSAIGGLNVAIAIVTAVYVFQLGIGSEWPVYFMSWLVPLSAVVWFVRPRARPPSRPSAPRAEHAAAL